MLPETDEVLELSIYNQQGRKVFSCTKQNIDISQLASGIYIIELNNGMSRSSGKFIKK